MMSKILLIPDGHRRYAEKVGIDLSAAYQLGATTAGDIVQGCLEKRLVSHLAIFALASKNFHDRAKSSLRAIIKSLDLFLDRVTPLTSSGLAVTYRGDLQRLPQATADAISQLTAQVYHVPPSLLLELLIDYCGEDDLLCQDVNLIRRKLAEPFDVIVRTGGNFRLSGAPPFECYNSEMVSLPCMFPEMRLSDLSNALIRVEQDRQRRATLRNLEIERP